MDPVTKNLPYKAAVSLGVPCAKNPSLLEWLSTLDGAVVEVALTDALLSQLVPQVASPDDTESCCMHCREGPYSRAERGSAIRAVQCQACSQLVDRLWQLGCDWVHRESGLPDLRSTKRQLRFAEHTQVQYLEEMLPNARCNFASGSRRLRPLICRQIRTACYQISLAAHCCSACAGAQNAAEGVVPSQPQGRCRHEGSATPLPFAATNREDRHPGI